MQFQTPPQRNLQHMGISNTMTVHTVRFTDQRDKNGNNEGRWGRVCGLKGDLIPIMFASICDSHMHEFHKF
jgi:hypothetical protein